MKAIATTHMSSKGQIVIPENIRKQLNLKEGTQFVVVGENDVVMLKTIEAPIMEDFDNLIQQARAQAKNVGLKKSDIKAAIKKASGHE
ncbi:MAG: AbrB family transcriptional regulator [Chloroflexi bacterium HGW-Chloroflexi-2]|jgi:AbrB family looped-hinge helix DNA binding protein|nr:MAG: AbrB family transcriptional regulator [Chloroflexi bacterium HGW-Chloroflexi-2]